MLEGKIKSILEEYHITGDLNKKWLGEFSKTLYDLGILEDDLLYISPSKAKIVNLNTGKVFLYSSIFALSKDSIVISVNTFLYKKLVLVELIDIDISNISIISPTSIFIKTNLKSYELNFQKDSNCSEVVYNLLKSSIELKNKQ